MRFLLTALPGSNQPANVPPDPRLMAAMADLTERMTQAGKLVMTGGMDLTGTRVRLAAGEVAVLDGPYAEAKEVIGGYAIVEAASREEALEMAKEFLELHRQILGNSYEADSIVQRLYGPWDADGCVPPQ